MQVIEQIGLQSLVAIIFSAQTESSRPFHECCVLSTCPDYQLRLIAWGCSSLKDENDAHAVGPDAPIANFNFRMVKPDLPRTGIGQLLAFAWFARHSLEYLEPVQITSSQPSLDIRNPTFRFKPSAPASPHVKG